MHTKTFDLNTFTVTFINTCMYARKARFVNISCYTILVILSILPGNLPFFFFECAQKLKHSETCNVIVLYVNMKKEQNYERPSASILRDVTETGKCPFLKGTNYCMG